MNRTIKDATVKRYHYDSHDQLRRPLADFLDAYNHARRLKTLSVLTPYEYICKSRTSEPDRFFLDPIHQMTELNMGLIFINRNGLRWRDMRHAEYGRPRLFTVAKKRWSEKGIFARMLLELADQGGGTETLMIDATHLKTHRTGTSMHLKKGEWSPDWARQERDEYAVTDAVGRPLRMFLTAGQRSDYIGARALLRDLPEAKHMLADCDHDADCYREALEEKGNYALHSFTQNAQGAHFRTTRTDARNAIKSRTVLPASRTGGGLQHAMTDAQKSSCQHVTWQRWSCSGYEP